MVSWDWSFFGGSGSGGGGSGASVAGGSFRASTELSAALLRAFWSSSNAFNLFCSRSSSSGDGGVPDTLCWGWIWGLGFDSAAGGGGIGIGLDCFGGFPSSLQLAELEKLRRDHVSAVLALNCTLLPCHLDAPEAAPAPRLKSRNEGATLLAISEREAC